MDQDQLGTEVGLGPRDIALDGDPALTPTPKGAQHPQFSARVYCGETTGWTGVPLGMEVGLGPVHILLDGDQLPPPKRHRPSIFGTCLLWPNGWVD